MEVVAFIGPCAVLHDYNLQYYTPRFERQDRSLLKNEIGPGHIRSLLHTSNISTRLTTSVREAYASLTVIPYLVALSSYCLPRHPRSIRFLSLTSDISIIVHNRLACDE